jgi:4-methyl-5(b-hydroxyethyl)-thiazole monophosphate biosynthesis
VEVKMSAAKQAKHVLVPLAEGFEELEAVCLIDVLRRAEIPVVVAGLAPGPVRGSHGITLLADCTLEEVDHGVLDAIVLPGGMPGAEHLMEDARILAIVRRLHAAGRPTAAICAAPIVLHAAGIVQGRSVTAHPSVRRRLSGAEVLAEPRVVKDGPVWTSQGPGTALEFALAIVEELRGADTARRLGEAMLVA